MLQRIRDKSSGLISYFILGLIIIAMALFGLEQYFSPNIETYAAKIEGPSAMFGFGGQERAISQDEFRRRFEQVRERERQQRGQQFDAATFETVENKRRVLDAMVDEAVLGLLAEREGIAVGEADVAEQLKQMPEFQVNGQYDPEQYRLGLAARRMSHAQFIALVGQDMATRAIPAQLAGSGIATDGELLEFLALSQQTRDLQLFELPTPGAPAEPDEAALRAWYEANAARYRREETVAIEYVEIDAAILDVPAVADEQTLRGRYQEQRARFVTEPVREAAHILVSVAADADDAAVEAARMRAAAIAADVAAPGADFAAIASAKSDDLGSRGDGGYLGPVEPGVFDAAFEQALSSLSAPGQTTGPVRTAAGWHVIRLAGLTPGSERSFEDVRAELEAEFAATERERLYNDRVNALVEAVYKDPNALAPAAEALGLGVQRTGPFGRADGTGLAAIAEVRAAAFADAQRLERQVSDPVEIGPSQVVVLQVVDHTPEATLPFEQVRERVRTEWMTDALGKASEAQARDLLERARAGEPLEALAAEVGRTVASLPGVGRQAPLPLPVREAAFQLPAPEAGKASYAIARVAADRHALVAVTAVNPGDLSSLDDAGRAMLREQLARARGEAELEEFVKALRQHYTVTVAEDRL